MGVRRKDNGAGDNPTPEACPERVTRMVRWFDQHARDLPWRRTQDPYAVWISEVMLQQTQVQTVIPYWTRWMERLPDVQALADAPEELVLKLWEGLGYYSRARNLQRAARRIVDERGGVFPGDSASLLDLPGIGPYTAGAIASIALDQPEPLLDGNVMRVLTRWFALEGDPRTGVLNQRLWRLATEWVVMAQRTAELGTRRVSRFNQSLMELGATICTPGAQPACDRCPVAQACEARRRGCPGRFPELAPRPAITPRFFATGLVEHQGRFLLRLREDTDVNRGFWEFPNWETGDSERPESVLSRHLGVSEMQWVPMADLRHHITRFRMTQRIRYAQAAPASEPSSGTWLWATKADLESLPLTSAHRKLARRLP